MKGISLFHFLLATWHQEIFINCSKSLIYLISAIESGFFIYAGIFDVKSDKML